jgi:predicted DCC family thiol-disulfide oxidoreductase YuxK
VCTIDRQDTEAHGADRRTWAPQAVGSVLDGLILFDGVCGFCSRWVRFVISRDREAKFRFLAIQTEGGRALAERLAIDPDDPETNAVVLGGVAYTKSDAALMVLRALPGWRWVGIGLTFPKPLRDWAYDRIAENRYRIFGRFDACMVAPPDVRSRFVESPPAG